MEDLLIWGLGLLSLAALLVVVEFFVPSGGVLGLTAAIIAIAGVVCLFFVGPLWGAIGSLAALMGGPAAIYFGLKFWPHTPVGRRIIGEPSEEQRESSRRVEAAAHARTHALIGKEGLVLTDLRPVGTVEVDGQRYDALAETHMLRAGVRIKVTGVDVAQLRVREVRT